MYVLCLGFHKPSLMIDKLLFTLFKPILAPPFLLATGLIALPCLDELRRLDWQAASSAKRSHGRPEQTQRILRLETW